MLIYKNKSLIFQPAAPEQSNTWIFHSLAPLKHSNVVFHQVFFLKKPWSCVITAQLFW